MNNKNDHTVSEEIPVTLKLKENVAEVVRILAHARMALAKKILIIS